MDDCFLTQHVLKLTRGPNILDFVLTSEPEMVDMVMVGCPVAGSDHNLISFNFHYQAVNSITRQNSFNYLKGDYLTFNNNLKLISWEPCFHNLST